MRSGGGRPVPMVRGFLRDGPAKMLVDWEFGAPRGGQAGASPPHRSLRPDPRPPR